MHGGREGVSEKLKRGGRCPKAPRVSGPFCRVIDPRGAPIRPRRGLKRSIFATPDRSGRAARGNAEGACAAAACSRGRGVAHRSGGGSAPCDRLAASERRG